MFSEQSANRGYRVHNRDYVNDVRAGHEARNAGVFLPVDIDPQSDLAQSATVSNYRLRCSSVTALKDFAAS